MIHLNNFPKWSGIHSRSKNNANEKNDAKGGKRNLIIILIVKISHILSVKCSETCQ